MDYKVYLIGNFCCNNLESEKPEGKDGCSKITETRKQKTGKNYSTMEIFIKNTATTCRKGL